MNEIQVCNLEQLLSKYTSSPLMSNHCMPHSGSPEQRALSPTRSLPTPLPVPLPLLLDAIAHIRAPLPSMASCKRSLVFILFSLASTYMVHTTSLPLPLPQFCIKIFPKPGLDPPGSSPQLGVGGWGERSHPSKHQIQPSGGRASWQHADVGGIAGLFALLTNVHRRCRIFLSLKLLLSSF